MRSNVTAATEPKARTAEDDLNDRPVDPTVQPSPETQLVEVTLEEYINSEIPNGYGEFRLVANRNPDKTLKFYLHPLNRDGETRDFAVNGDEVVCITRIAVPQPRADEEVEA